MDVTGSQFGLLSRLLDVASLRHQVLAQNIANVNTPGYHRQEVTFESAFQRFLQQGKESRALGLAPRVVQAAAGRERVDGNNVDIDTEMGRLSKNALLYNVYSQILAANIASMRSAITGH